MEEQLTNTEVVSALAYQVAVFAIFVCLMTDGIKTVIKMVMGKGKEDKLSKWVTLGLVSTFGLSFGFLIQSPMAVSVVAKLAFGLVIGTFAFTSYDSVIKGLLKLIPKLMDRLFKK